MDKQLIYRPLVRSNWFKQ